MTLSLRGMRYVQEALRKGSIKAAAEAMNVAPSAIATALDQAEAAFGMSLVTRARAKGIFPTLAGREVQRRIDDLLERYDAMLIDVSDYHAGLSGTLSIAYNAPVAPAFLPGMCADVLAAHPDVTLTLTEGTNSEVRAGLLDGQFDVIVFVEDVPNPQIATQPLVFAPTYCVCPADHRFAQRRSVHVSEIVQEPLILLDRPAAHSYYMELLEQSGAPFRIVATVNSTEMVRSLVGQGLGLSLLNMRPRDIPAYSGNNVRCLEIEGTSNGVQMSLGMPMGRRRLLTQVFVDACAAFFDGPQGAEFIVPGHHPD